MDLHILQPMWQKSVILIYIQWIIKILVGLEAKREDIFNQLLPSSNKHKILLIIF